MRIPPLCWILWYRIFTKFIIMLILPYFCRVLRSMICTKFKCSVIFSSCHITVSLYGTFHVLFDASIILLLKVCTQLSLLLLIISYSYYCWMSWYVRGLFQVQIFSYNNAVEFYNIWVKLKSCLLLFTLPYYCWISGSMICPSVWLTI